VPAKTPVTWIILLILEIGYFANAHIERLRDGHLVNGPFIRISFEQILLPASACEPGGFGKFDWWRSHAESTRLHPPELDINGISELHRIRQGGLTGVAGQQGQERKHTTAEFASLFQVSTFYWLAKYFCELL
jgi:hypothetical protein